MILLALGLALGSGSAFAKSKRGKPNRSVPTAPAKPTPPLAEENGRFPTQPDQKLTPGSLCVTPDTYRYPEKVPYCERNVDTDRKWEIIRTYDVQLGYQVERMNRADFKIDHFIPLCMGGSNETVNLWPQHKSVYADSDLLEGPLCDLMSKGKMTQDEAIDIIRKVKLHEMDAEAALAAVRKRL